MASVALKKKPHSESVVLKGHGTVDPADLRHLGIGIYELRKRQTIHPEGAIILPNRELTTRSPIGATHMVFPNILTAILSQRLIVGRGGTKYRSLPGEMAILKEKESRVYLFLHEVLLQMVDPEKESILRRAVQRIKEQLLNSRNPHLVKLVTLVDRGLRDRDRLGRVNRPAAAMATSAALTRVQLRTDELRLIASILNVRYLVLWDEIHQIMQLYWEAREALRRLPDPMPPLAEDLEPYSRLAVHLLPDRPQGMATLRQAAGRFARIFEGIKTLPFAKNAAYIAADFREVERLAGEESPDRKQIQELLARIQQSIPYAFALVTLMFKVWAPLFYAAEADKLLKRMPRGRDAEHLQQAIYRQRMQALRNLRWFRARARRKLSDDGFKSPVLEPLHKGLEQAEAWMVMGEWGKGRRFVRLAVELL